MKVGLYKLKCDVPSQKKIADITNIENGQKIVQYTYTAHSMHGVDMAYPLP